jgi:Flp pilus assembly protein TadD
MLSRKPAECSSSCPIEQRLERARTRRRKREGRKALVLLREAACLAGSNPKVWTLYAIQCWRLNQRDEARKALRQALWLREKAGDERRARVVRQLLLGMEAACAPDELRAA